MEGVIRKKIDKGFGFISQEGPEKDLFFSGSSLVGGTFDGLQEGDKVTCDVAPLEKAPSKNNAVNVQRM